jgi:hypothetical protein
VQPKEKAETRKSLKEGQILKILAEKYPKSGRKNWQTADSRIFPLERVIFRFVSQVLKAGQADLARRAWIHLPIEPIEGTIQQLIQGSLRSFMQTRGMVERKLC